MGGSGRDFKRTRKFLKGCRAYFILYRACVTLVPVMWAGRVKGPCNSNHLQFKGNCLLITRYSPENRQLCLLFQGFFLNYIVQTCWFFCRCAGAICHAETVRALAFRRGFPQNWEQLLGASVVCINVCINAGFLFNLQNTPAKQ